VPPPGPAGHHGQRGYKDDPLYAARRTLHTGAGLLTDRQAQRLRDLFPAEEHLEVQATWDIYQRMIGAYRESDPKRGRDLMAKLIDSVSRGVPAPLIEVITLGRTVKERVADVLSYFDRPGTGNGPTEAINGRLEHLRGSALGSATRATTSPDNYSGPADSDPDQTPDREEPHIPTDAPSRRATCATSSS
jgi:transposase